MTCLRRASYVGFVASLVLYPLATASAQQQETQPTNPSRARRGGAVIQQRAGQRAEQQPVTEQAVRPRHGAVDARLATWAAVGNEGEVELAKFAMDKASSEGAKQFAQKMIQDHTAYLRQLQRLGAEVSPDALAGAKEEPGQAQAAPGQRPAANGAEAAPSERADDQVAQTQPRANRAAAIPPRVNADRPGIAQQVGDGAGPGRHLDFLAIKKEIGRQCLESSKQALSEKSGKEFDKCYIGQQVMAHMAMIDTLKVLKNHGSPNFAQVADHGIQTAQTHLEHAKSMLKEIEGKSGESDRSAN